MPGEAAERTQDYRFIDDHHLGELFNDFRREQAMTETRVGEVIVGQMRQVAGRITGSAGDLRRWIRYSDRPFFFESAARTIRFL